MLEAMRIALGLAAVTSLAIIGTTQGAATDQAQRGEIVYNAVIESMVVVETSNGSQGSGVVIGENHVVTNCHVVSDDGEIAVTKFAEVEGEVRPFEMHAETVEANSDHDLCVLQVEGLSFSPAPTPAKLGSTSEIATGESIYAVGSPYGYTHTVTGGLISQLRSCEDFVDFNCEDHSAPIIQIDAAISPGSSGGGLFTTQAKLIGVPTSIVILPHAENISLAVPVEWIKNLNIYPEIAKKNALSEARNGNFTDAVEIAGDIHDLAIQARTLARIASLQLSAGHFADARAVIARAARAAELIESPVTGREKHRRNTAWETISKVQASLGEYAEAKFAASMIDFKPARASTLRAIADEQIDDGMTTAAKETLLVDTLGIVRQIRKASSRARNYARTAVLLAQIGEMGAAEEAFANAKAIVEEGIGSAFDRELLSNFIDDRRERAKKHYGEAS